MNFLIILPVIDQNSSSQHTGKEHRFQLVHVTCLFIKKHSKGIFQTSQLTDLICFYCHLQHKRTEPAGTNQVVSAKAPLNPWFRRTWNNTLRGLHYPVWFALSACPFSTFFIDIIFTVFDCEGKPVTLCFSWVLKWSLILTSTVNSHTVVTATRPFYYSLTLNSCLSSFLTYCAEM